MVGTLALVFWRRWPVVVVGIVAITTAVYVGRGYAGGPALLPGPLALLAVGYATPRRVGWIAAAGYVAMAAVARLVFGDAEITQLLVLVGWASAAVLAGQAIAARAERTANDRERHAHAQEQALTNERLRIARDLHDSVAHAIATINVQSGVAAHLIDRDPAQAKRALEAIRAASSDALDELTAILSVLRSGVDDDGRAAHADRHAGRDRRARRQGPLGRPRRRRCGPRRRRDAGTSVSSAALPRRPGGADQHPPPRRFVGSRTGRRLRGRTGRGDHPRSATTGAAGPLHRWPTRRRRVRLLGMRERRRGDGGHARRPSAAGGRVRGGRGMGCKGRDPRRARRRPGARAHRVRALLDAEDDIEVVGEAGNGAEAVALALELPPRRRADGHPHAGDRRPDRDPPDRRERRPRRRQGARAHHVRARRVRLRGAAGGASGFLVKHTEPAELIRAVRVVADGEALLSPGVTRRLIAAFANVPTPAVTGCRALAELLTHANARWSGSSPRGCRTRRSPQTAASTARPSVRALATSSPIAPNVPIGARGATSSSTPLRSTERMAVSSSRASLLAAADRLERPRGLRRVAVDEVGGYARLHVDGRDRVGDGVVQVASDAQTLVGQRLLLGVGATLAVVGGSGGAAMLSGQTAADAQPTRTADG